MSVPPALPPTDGPGRTRRRRAQPVAFQGARGGRRPPAHTGMRPRPGTGPPSRTQHDKIVTARCLGLWLCHRKRDFLPAPRLRDTRPRYRPTHRRRWTCRCTGRVHHGPRGIDPGGRGSRGYAMRPGSPRRRAGPDAIRRRSTASRARTAPWPSRAGNPADRGQRGVRCRQSSARMLPPPAAADPRTRKLAKRGRGGDVARLPARGCSRWRSAEQPAAAGGDSGPTTAPPASRSRTTGASTPCPARPPGCPGRASAGWGRSVFRRRRRAAAATRAHPGRRSGCFGSRAGR